MAMVGGGSGAFIGAVHRMAARLAGNIELVAGAFSSDPTRSRDESASLGIAGDRSYGDWRQMLTEESARPAGERPDFVAIVTPNDLHLPIATLAMNHGFHVLSDKPATRTLDEARDLAAVVAKSGCRYALTHVYLGYPLVAEARARVARGDLGPIRRIEVTYTQGWLAAYAPSAVSKQAAWRTDPRRSGPGGAIADIGVHAFTLAEFVSGLRVERVLADLAAVVEGREVDDDANCLLQLSGGARGVLTASQVATGEGNRLSLRLYGDRGGLSWNHDRPDRLTLSGVDGMRLEISAGRDNVNLDERSRELCRLPAGHPEGFIEAFANLYRLFAADIGHAESGDAALSPAPIEVALRGMAFIDAAIASSRSGNKWVELDTSMTGAMPA